MLSTAQIAAPAARKAGYPRILVLCADTTTRNQVVYALGAVCTFDLTDSGETALAMAAAHTYDAVVIETSLPEGSGLEVCRALKAIAGYDRVPVLFIAPDTSILEHSACFSKYMIDFVLAPVQVEVFAHRLRTLLELKDKVKAVRSYVRRKERRAKEEAYERAQLTDSMTYAARIQQAFLPPLHKLEEAFAGHAIWYAPRDIISGDFYWFNQVKGKWVVAVGDCTGHGVPAALLSTMGHNLLEQICSIVAEPSADQILSLLNFRLVCALQMDHADLRLNDGMDVVIFVYDKDTREMEIASANMAYYIQRAGNVARVRPTPYPVGGAPLGQEQDALERMYESTTFTMAPGDRIYMFSDGIVDQHIEENGKLQKFTARAMVAALEAGAGLPVSFAVDKLKQDFHAFRQDAPQTDDILLMGLQF